MAVSIPFVTEPEVDYGAVVEMAPRPTPGGGQQPGQVHLPGHRHLHRGPGPGGHSRSRPPTTPITSQRCWPRWTVSRWRPCSSPILTGITPPLRRRCPKPPVPRPMASAPIRLLMTTTARAKRGVISGLLPMRRWSTGMWWRDRVGASSACTPRATSPTTSPTAGGKRPECSPAITSWAGPPPSSPRPTAT